MSQNRDPIALSHALAEPSCRALLENLRFGQKSVGELVSATGLKQPNVSNHLARLRSQGIVRSERLGRHVYYSIALPIAELLLRLHETTADPLTGGQGEESVALLHAAAGEARPAGPWEQPPDPAGTESQLSVEAVREAFFRAILAGQEDRALALVNDLLAHRTDLTTIFYDVFEWAMHRVGEYYLGGNTDVAHEHMASAITERMVARVAQFYTPVARRPYRALLGGVAGNYHMLGLRMLSDGLRTQGWETLYLGANVPTSSFVAMATTERPDLVVITCMQEENLEELKLLLRQLQAARREHDELHYRITAGGQFLNQSPQVVRTLSLDFSASTLYDFLESVNHFYPPTNPMKK